MTNQIRKKLQLNKGNKDGLKEAADEPEEEQSSGDDNI